MLGLINETQTKRGKPLCFINKQRFFGYYKNMNKKLPKIIVLLGPTACGKTKMAVKLARCFDGEIISADSRQVYKGLDIGSGKDLAEYKNVRFHLIDVCSPRRQFNLSRYLILARKAIKNIIRNGKLPIICGGTGLYAEALFAGYQLSPIKPLKQLRSRLLSLPINELRKMCINKKINNSDLHNKFRLIRIIEKNNHVENKIKPTFTPFIFAITIEKTKLKNNIEKRLIKRLRQGLLKEVAGLHKNGLSWQRLESFGLEYKIVSQYLQNKISYQQMKAEIIKQSLKYAKRQLTWLRRPILKNHIIWITSYLQFKKLVKIYLKQ
jgi:tRNA dimethylallyltransferase